MSKEVQAGLGAVWPIAHWVSFLLRKNPNLLGPAWPLLPVSAELGLPQPVLGPREPPDRPMAWDKAGCCQQVILGARGFGFPKSRLTLFETKPCCSASPFLEACFPSEPGTLAQHRLLENQDPQRPGVRACHPPETPARGETVSRENRRAVICRGRQGLC